jgi:hypothetical protein
VDYVLKFMQIAEHNDRMGNGLKQQQQQQRNHGRMGEEGELLLLGGGGGGDRFRVPSSHALDNFVEKFLKSDGVCEGKWANIHWFVNVLLSSSFFGWWQTTRANWSLSALSGIFGGKKTFSCKKSPQICFYFIAA